MQGDGKGSLFVPQGLVDGPLPTHYEPAESVFRNPLYAQQANPTRKEYERKENRINPSPPEEHSEVFPFIFTVSRLTEHHTAGAMSRNLEYLSELQPEMFVEVSPELAAERGLEHMGWCHVVTARSAVEGRVMVTDRLTPLRIEGRVLHQVWLPYHFGGSGLVTGDSANDLFGISLDPNVLIQESKAGTCDVRPAVGPPGRHCWSSWPATSAVRVSMTTTWCLTSPRVRDRSAMAAVSRRRTRPVRAAGRGAPTGAAQGSRAPASRDRQRRPAPVGRRCGCHPSWSRSVATPGLPGRTGQSAVAVCPARTRCRWDQPP